MLRPSVRTVVLGGVAEPYSFELTGPLATATMRDLWLDTMFVGTVGLDLNAGLTCNSDAEAGVTRIMIGHSRRVVGLATADKLGHRALAWHLPGLGAHGPGDRRRRPGRAAHPPRGDLGAPARGLRSRTGGDARQM